MAQFVISEPVRTALLELVRNGGTATHDQCRCKAREKLFNKRVRALFDYNLAVDTGASLSDADPAGTRLYRITPAGLIAYLTGFMDLDWRENPPAGSTAYAAVEAELVQLSSVVGKMKRTPSWPARSSSSPPTTSGGGGSGGRTARPSSSRPRTAGGRSR